jgi:hypothetical protein
MHSQVCLPKRESDGAGVWVCLRGAAIRKMLATLLLREPSTTAEQWQLLKVVRYDLSIQQLKRGSF